MSKILTLTLLGCLTIFSSYAQDWIALGADGHGEQHYLHTRLINGGYGEGVGVWIKYKKTEYSTYKGKKTALRREVKQLYQVKCESNEIALVQTVVYSANGEVIRNHKEYPDFSAIIPDSIGEVVASKVCELGNTEMPSETEEMPTND